VAEPTAAHKAFAADAHAAFTALLDEGFTADQAIALLCQLVATPPARPASPDRTAAVAALLAGQRPPATRSPADDRAAGIWQTPTTDSSTAPQGAPAHE
jgi:hypothetical protein